MGYNETLAGSAHWQYSADHKARRVLIVDANLDFAETMADILKSSGYQLQIARHFDEVRELTFVPQVALLDIRLEERSTIDLIRPLQMKWPKLLCVMMVDYTNLESAIEMLKDNAYDYICKPVSTPVLFHTLDRCFQTVELMSQNQELDRVLSLRNQDLEGINNRLGQVVCAAQKLADCTRFTELSPILLNELSHILQAQGGSLYLLEDEHLNLICSLDSPHAPHTITMPLAHDSVFYYVTRRLEPLLIEKFSMQTEFHRSQWDGYESDSSLIFPILDSSGGLLALVSLHNKILPPFTELDKEIGSVLLSLSGEVMRSLQAFHALNENRLRFRELSELLPAIVFELDKDAVFTHLNREVQNITGFSPEELIGGNLSGLLPEWEKQRASAYLAGSHPAGETAVDLSLNHKNGTLMMVMLQAARIERSGKLAGYRGLIFDITQRKQTEKEHAQLAMAVEQATELILITDVNGKIHYANPAFLALTGYRQEDVQSLNFHDFENLKDDPTFVEQLWETLKRDNVWHGRVRSLKANKEVYAAEASISPLRDATGHVVNYVAVLRDLTREGRLEARLRQAEKLEAIGTLAGGIAHDFNNILSPIIGFTEIVREDLPTDSESNAHLGKVLSACHLAKDLVRRILTFCRQVENERRPVVVHQILSDALKFLRPSIPSTIKIVEEINLFPIEVFADPSQVHQLIMNLVTNAYQAMGNEGTITISLSQLLADDVLIRQVPRLFLGREYLCLKVQDTGDGMSEHVLERIFDPFFSTKEQGKGTGLGLATVHGILMELSGDIAVYSELNEGTCVSVYLPRHFAADHLELPAEHPELIRSGSRILLVDDEEMILKLGEMMLGRLGYHITTFNNSPDALQHFKCNPNAFDLVITDQTMPTLTGLQLAEAIKSVCPKIPILLTTGFSSVTKEEQIMGCGICQVVHKPFTRKELGDAIQAALGLVEQK